MISKFNFLLFTWFISAEDNFPFCHKQPYKSEVLMEQLHREPLALYLLCSLLGNHYCRIFLLQTKMMKFNTAEIRKIKSRRTAGAFQLKQLSEQSLQNSIKTGFLLWHHYPSVWMKLLYHGINLWYKWHILWNKREH